MSASSCLVETVHYSSAGMAQRSRESRSFYHHQHHHPTLNSSSVYQPANTLSIPISPGYQQMKTHQPMMSPPPPPSTPESSALPQVQMSVPLVPIDQATTSPQTPPQPRRSHPPPPRTYQPQLIATISAGFEKGDYLIREERGSNIYFDFFEEAYNFACQKGFTRMSKHEEAEYMDIVKWAHRSVPGGCRYNTGRLLIVLHKKLVPLKEPLEEEDSEPHCLVGDETDSCTKSTISSSSGENNDGTRKKKMDKKLAKSTNTLPTDSESYSGMSNSYTSASTSFVDSWE